MYKLHYQYTKFVLKLPMPRHSELNGFLIDLQVGQTDWRDYLTYEYEDGSREQWSISNGSQLKMWFLEEWVSVRYETMLPRSEYRVWLTLTIQSSVVQMVSSLNAMRCTFGGSDFVKTRQKTVSIPVMQAKCATCPFREGADLRLRADLQARLLERSQLCHHPKLHKKRSTHLCRGARDEQLTMMYRLGVLEQPTDQAWEAARVLHLEHQ
jgi:hypothetical protein